MLTFRKFYTSFIIAIQQPLKKRIAETFKKVSAAWNVGSSLTPVQGPMDYGKIIDEDKRIEVKNFVERIELNRTKKN